MKRVSIGIGSHRRLALSEKRLPYLLTLPSLLTIFGVLIIPILYSLFLSVHNLVLSSRTYEFVGLKHYIAMFSDKSFLNSIWQTLVFTVLSVAAEMVLGVGVALVLNQEFKGRGFLLGFLPVYAGVLTMGGETAAGSAASGFFLTILCFLAQCLTAFVRPLLQCYLALSMACCISTDHGLAAFCQSTGALLRQALHWAGKFLALLLGLQRVTALQLDRAALRTGQLLAGSVPIVGQTLSDVSEAFLAGIQLLKSGLGLAAIAFLGAEFFPLYLGMMLQLALLCGCSLFCSLTGNIRCKALLDCFAEAVRCMAAATALFFGLFIMGTVFLFLAGGG